MALAAFRRGQKRMKWIWWIVIVAMGGSMLLLFVDPPGGTSGGSFNVGEVAQVGEHRISGSEFKLVYDRLIQVARDVYRLDPNDTQTLRRLGLEQQAVGQLINDYAILVEAERLGIRATPEEISKEILRNFSDETGFVGKDRYREILLRYNLTAAEYEASVERILVRQKMLQLLTDGLDATEEEVRKEYLNRNQEAKVRYVSVNSVESRPENSPEEELQKYYEANTDRYQGGEKRKVRFVKIEYLPTSVEVTEEEVNARLAMAEVNRARFSHILVPFGEDEVKARAEAESILAEVRGGADFAELATARSKDATTASNGGDLGFISKGEKDPAFDAIAFGLTQDQVGEIARTPEGFHIIKQTEVEASLSTSVAQFQARQIKANSLALEMSEKFAADLAGGDDLETVATRNGIEMVTSDFFEAGQVVPGSQAPTTLTTEVFALEEGGVTEVMKVGSSLYFVAELIEIKAPEAQDLEDVRESVLEDYRTEKGQEIAEQRARDFARQTSDGKSLEDLAREWNLPVTETEFFRKGATVDDVLKFSPELHDDVFQMNPGDISAPIRVTENHIVYQLVDKSPVDEEQYERDKASIHDQLAQQKKSTFFQNYVRNVVDSLRKDNRIAINQELVTSVNG